MLTAEGIQTYFTATQLHDIWPQSKRHTQWPGSGLMGDPIFDAYYASTVQFLTSDAYQQTTMRQAGAALLDKIGRPVILISHSQGGFLGWHIVDKRPHLVHSVIALEPGGPPFEKMILGSGPARKYGLTDVPLVYSPAVTDPDTDLVKQTIRHNMTDIRCTIQAEEPPPRKLSNLAQAPVLVVTSESSYHAVYDWCTVRYLQQAGVRTEHMELGSVGIHGNGHMMFLELNSDILASKLLEWMEKSS